MTTRREFLKKLGSMAVAGTLAPQVAALLPAGVVPEPYDVGGWDGVGTPIADIAREQHRLIALGGGLPNTIVMPLDVWDALLKSELIEHHPALAEEFDIACQA